MNEASLRLDKWLWYARFIKSRSLATKLCSAGKVRVSGNSVSKAHFGVRVGDVLTFPQGRHIRVIEVVDLGRRRGPASEAQLLYRDLKPPALENRMPRATTQAGWRGRKATLLPLRSMP